MVDPQPMVQRLREHLPIAREGVDPEGVHQLRVASRRLRVFLELAGIRVLEDDLRWLRDSARLARDVDVVTEKHPPAPFAAWLRTRREPARAELLAALDDPRTEGLLEALSLLPPCDEGRARKALRRIAKKVNERAAVLADEDASLEDLHRLRRAVRRLRYALDWLGEDAKPVKKLQDALGEIGDVRATFELLEELPDDSTTRDYRESLQEHAQRSRERSEQAWEQIRSRVEGYAA